MATALVPIAILREAALQAAPQDEVLSVARRPGCDWPPHIGLYRKPVTTKAYIWY